MSTGTEWLLAVVAIVLIVAALEVKPAWGGMLLLIVVTVMMARGLRNGSIVPPGQT